MIAYSRQQPTKLVTLLLIYLLRSKYNGVEAFGPTATVKTAFHSKANSRTTAPRTTTTSPATLFGGRALSAPTRSTQTITSTKLNVFRNDHDAITKLASPFVMKQTTTKIALLLASAITAPSLQATASVTGSIQDATNTIIASAAADTVGTPPNLYVEAELLSDFHIVFDLLTFMGNANATPLRVASIVARILSLAADYVPDHRVLPEEFVFQTFMISIGFAGLMKAALPTVLSWIHHHVNLPTTRSQQQNTGLSVRERKVYSALFAPLGLSWRQYKALSTFALDWETVVPGHVIIDEESHQETSDKSNEYVYWLYSGQVIVSSKGKVLFDKRANSTSFRQDVGKRLLGENCLLECVDGECKIEYEDGATKKATMADTNPFPSTTARAGAEGATLLRIHKKNLDLLLQVSDDSDAYVETIRKLVFQGFKDKLAARMSTEV